MGGLIRQVLIFQWNIKLHIAIARRSRSGRELAVGDDIGICRILDILIFLIIIKRESILGQGDQKWHIDPWSHPARS